MSLDLELNPAQRAAVEHPAGPILVVAGAGSGQTRVLTARVARLLENGVPAETVLALPFTHRSAGEMRGRIERVVGSRAQGLWVGTFHATAVRILRSEGSRLSIPRNFVIYDREDQESVLRGVMKHLEVPEGSFKLGALLGRISDAKNALVNPEEMARLAIAPDARRVAECYAGYQDQLRRDSALDFDDLIAETVRLLDLFPDIKVRLSARFRHVLVDEYQDTNHVQFRMIRSLVSTHGSVFAVGDDDQSIYGWRGANLSNLLDFEDAFPGASLVRLEQNYRSTARILAAANAVIANNRARRGKTLWCEREDGAPLTFVLAEDEVDEARQIRGFLAEQVREGGKLGDCAVLYRTNAQSRALETELRQGRVPYQIVGGVSFFQRREVKDLLAYLRLAVNPEDAVAFWRIWNVPRRGLGPSVQLKVEERMSRDGITPLQALRDLVNEGPLTRGARAGAESLLGIVDELRSQLDAPVEALFVRLLERTRYLEALDDQEDAADRRANVQELGNAAAAFTAQGRGGLGDFLAETALVSEADYISESTDRVLLLTAHNAKGLEFRVVIVAGLEEGLFPHASSQEQAEELEEERRLFYVALTRARDRAILTAAAYRRRYDGARGGAVSRFVDEIPAELIERQEGSRTGRIYGNGMTSGDRKWARARTWESSDAVNTGVQVAVRHRAIGREVYHESFGRGVVVEAEGRGVDMKFTVRFGTKLRKVLGRFLVGGDDGA